MNKRNQILILLSLLAGVAALQYFGIMRQGFIFHDEGYLFLRAEIIKKFFQDQPVALTQYAGYTDSKILWLGFVMLAQVLFHGHLFSAHFLSLAFGLISILMTGYLAKKYYNSPQTGFLSACCFALLPSFFFYSRLALPETAGMVLTLGCLICYVSRHKGNVVLAGILAACAFLTNRYRVMMLPFFILILEWGWLRKARNQSHLQSLKSFLLFCIITAVSVAIYPVIVYIFRNFQIVLPAYLKGFHQSLASHALPSFHWQAFRVYTYYIYEFEGLAVLLLLGVGALFIRAPSSTWIPLCFVLLQIFGSAWVDEQVPRNLSIVLPFIAMVIALTFQNIYGYLKDSRTGRILFFLFCLACTASLMEKTLKVVTAKTDLLNVAAGVQQIYPQGQVITTNPSYRVYNPAAQLIFPFQNNGRKYAPEDFTQDNPAVFIFDPQAQILHKYHKIYNWDNNYAAFVDGLAGHCPIVLFYENFNPYYRKRFIFEQVKVAPFEFAKLFDEESFYEFGQILVFDLSRCQTAK